MNIIDALNAEHQQSLNKDIPDFRPGDTVCVNIKVVEGSRQRIQAFEGVCIARARRGLNARFTVRKISHGEGVERVFPLYSPMVDSITVVRQGHVKRSKLYYLRALRGRAARIKERRPLTKSGAKLANNKEKPARQETPAKQETPVKAKEEAAPKQEA